MGVQFLRNLNKTLVETYMTNKTPKNLYRDGWWKFFDYLNIGSINLNTYLRNPMTQHYNFYDQEVTLFPVKNLITLFTLFQYLG